MNDAPLQKKALLGNLPKLDLDGSQDDFVPDWGVRFLRQDSQSLAGFYQVHSDLKLILTGLHLG